MNDSENQDAGAGAGGEASEAGEEDPGAAGDDPAMQRAMQGEAAVVRRTERQNPMEKPMDRKSPWQRWREFDEARPSAPGEHWFVLGVGVALLLYATGRRSPLGRTLMRTAATGLIARALSGRDGVQRVMR